ncbi:MAG: PTS sugar transporter subunit IIC [Brevinema sp.]
MNQKNHSDKISLIKTLNGMSLAIAIALIPGALLGELVQFITRYYPVGVEILKIINLCTTMLPLVIGICVASQHHLDTIQSISVGFAATIGSGVISSIAGGVYSFTGTGDVINAGLTSVLAVWLIIKFCRPLKSMAIIIVPTFIPVITGLIGIMTLPYVSLISQNIGNTINYFTTLQPILMGILIAMVFTIIIVSPISTVGIAYSIGISGVAAAAANTGVAVAAIVLAMLSYKTNPIGTVLAHVFGTPKIQMANFIKKPVMLLPCLLVSAVLGGITGILNFQMTTQAAGFGIVGGIGPVALMNHLGWTGLSGIITLTYFLGIPLALGKILQQTSKKLSIISDEDYTLEY